MIGSQRSSVRGILHLAVPSHTPQGSEAVTHADFFAFRIGAAVVGDRAFRELHAGGFCEPSGQFDFDAESIFLQSITYLSKPSRFNQLVARFDIRQAEPKTPIGQLRDESISLAMPDGRSAWFIHEKPTTVHHVGLLVFRNGQQPHQVVGIVFGIGVLDTGPGLSHVLKTGPQRRAFSLIDGVRQDLKPPGQASGPKVVVQLVTQGCEAFAGLVAAGVVNDNDLGHRWNTRESLQNRQDGVFLVEHRDHHRDQQ